LTNFSTDSEFYLKINIYLTLRYNCNRYDEEEAKAARDAQEKSRSALQRYLFYCNRYMNHMQSLKFENKLYASIKEKMEEMQQHNMSWIEVQFLKKAVDILCQCRQTLMYTYVFAYYLRKNNQSVIFEVWVASFWGHF
jgi:ariadne-1